MNEKLGINNTIVIQTMQDLPRTVNPEVNNYLIQQGAQVFADRHFVFSKNNVLGRRLFWILKEEWAVVLNLETLGYYIELPKAFAEEVHHIDQIPNETEIIDSPVLNKTVYRISLINEDNCLVKLSDTYISELMENISFDTTEVDENNNTVVIFKATNVYTLEEKKSEYITEEEI